MTYLYNRALLPIGTLLHTGTYRVEKCLSSGGFSNTYVVTNVQFNDNICYAMKEFYLSGICYRNEQMKVCVSRSENSEIDKANKKKFLSQIEKFKNEARRLKKLMNPNIVRVYELFEENGTAYYIMDYVDGESYAEKVQPKGMPLLEQDAVSLLQQILNALEEIHCHQIWHLDLKPANIMQGEGNRILLIDFGASKQIDASLNGLNPTTLCYTPGYASPEQIDCDYKRIGPWSDFYALGATLYYLQTCHQPPNTGNVKYEGASAFHFPSTMSTPMRELILWLMKYDYSERPQSVDDLRKWLELNRLTVNNNTVCIDNKTVVGVPRRSFISFSKKWFGLGFILLAICTICMLILCGKSKSIAIDDDEEYDTEKDVVLERLVANMVYVDGGTFMMGSDAPYAYNDEKPVHQVTLSSFYIGCYEVTQEEWEAIMGENPSKNKGARLPVENVTWGDCQNFIMRLNEKTGRHFRLPTEAEWEYAARGGKDSRGYRFSGGNDIDPVAWYEANSMGMTHDVGLKAPNELGLYDMTGNVREWCQDLAGNYGSEAQLNPTGPSTSSQIYVVRGAGFSSKEVGENGGLYRVTNRQSSANSTTGKAGSLGFRLVMSY